MTERSFGSSTNIEPSMNYEPCALAIIFSTVFTRVSAPQKFEREDLWGFKRQVNSSLPDWDVKVSRNDVRALDPWQTTDTSVNFQWKNMRTRARFASSGRIYSAASVCVNCSSHVSLGQRSTRVASCFKLIFLQKKNERERERRTKNIWTDRQAENEHVQPDERCSANLTVGVPICVYMNACVHVHLSCLKVQSLADE